MTLAWATREKLRHFTMAPVAWDGPIYDPSCIPANVERHRRIEVARAAWALLVTHACDPDQVPALGALPKLLVETMAHYALRADWDATGRTRCIRRSAGDPDPAHPTKKRRPGWNSWRAICQRTESRTHRAWQWYGANGVRMDVVWRSCVGCMLDDLGDRPAGPPYVWRISRDRDLGNYAPGNVRWQRVHESAGKPPWWARLQPDE